MFSTSLHGFHTSTCILVILSQVCTARGVQCTTNIFTHIGKGDERVARFTQRCSQGKRRLCECVTEAAASHYRISTVVKHYATLSRFFETTFALAARLCMASDSTTRLPIRANAFRRALTKRAA